LRRFAPVIKSAGPLSDWSVGLTNAYRLHGRALFGQLVSDRQDQVAAVIVRGLAARIFDPAVARVVSERPVLEFSVRVLDIAGQYRARAKLRAIRATFWCSRSILKFT
jgi:hypothetical protein